MQRQWIHSDYRRVLLEVILLLTLLATPLYAEWFKDYESAMDLIKKNQWGAAIPKLKSALSQKDDEGSNIKFYGMKFADYFPHFYLGLACFNTGDYESAIKAFEQSERYGAIQRKGDLFAKLGNVKALAKAQIVSKTPVEIAKNTTVQPSVTQPAVTQPQVQPKEEPKKVVELSRSESKKIEEARIEQKKPPVVVPATTPPPVDIDLETAKRMVHSAARKYFEGDYDGAISLLVTALEVSPSNAPAQFLLGCSYASKYLISGSEDQDSFRKASSAFQKSKKINPNYRVKDKSYFSPAVLEIYAKLG